MTSKPKSVPPAAPSTAPVKEKQPGMEVDDGATEVIRKVELIDKIVEQTGIKKKDVKPSVEACLALIAEALVDGKSLVLPPMGKLKVMKLKELDNGAKALTLKLRLSKASDDTDEVDQIAAE